ncbi:MAG: hypothetical protein ACR2QF_00875 [Geminicoccaceae bacterium]
MRHQTHSETRFSLGLPNLSIPILMFAFLMAVALLSNSKQADAQQVMPCATHDSIVKRLGAKFTEKPVSLGIAGDGKLLEVFAAKDGSTWSIVVTAPEGMSCIVAVGKFWQNLPTHPDGPDV